MHGGCRRFLRRPQRRRRILAIVAAGIAVFFLFTFFFSFSSPPDDRIVREQQQQQQQQPFTWRPPVTAALTINPRSTQQDEGHIQPGRQQNSGLNGNTTQPPVTVEPARVNGLYQQYPKELAELEALDLFTPRQGEEKVTFNRFAACLGAMLAVDPVERTELPRDDPASIRELPLLISVTAGNTQDLKAMICNLSVPYKYIVLAQSGDTPEMTPFFDLLVRVFNFTKRLVVLQYKKSIGFAGAVNGGLREALRHPFDEVPFIHIVHNDVRYLQSALQESIKDAYLDVKRDKAIIAKLEAELKTEPNEHTPLIWRPRGLRAPITPEAPLPQLRGNKGVLVTSALLPDRVRYMGEKERKQQFADHISFSFHNSRGEYTAVYLSRLAVLTVGFFDENFYPVMFDDTDFRWRASMLGFRELRLADFDKTMIAFDVDCTNVKLDDDGRPGLVPPNMPDDRRLAIDIANNNKHNSKPQLSPATKALLRECPTAFNRMMQFKYMAVKWGITDFVQLGNPQANYKPYTSEAFSGKAHLPLDAWVADTRRIASVKKALRDTGGGGLFIEPYNPKVIWEALE
ncbi:galactofuranosyltransferase lpg1-like protein [Lotmaria passim]